MCLTEFNEKVFVKSIREEGIELGEFSMLVKLVKKDDCRWKKLYRKVSLPRGVPKTIKFRGKRF